MLAIIVLHPLIKNSENMNSININGKSNNKTAFHRQENTRH